VTEEWAVARFRGDAAEFHARPMPEPVRRAAWWFEVDRPALVLGSAQPESDVDAAAVARAGVEVIRRRSGGGAVVLAPGDTVWVDLLIPASDRRWRDDIGLATHWVGRLWAGVLGELGVEATVHTGGMVRSHWSARACFAGLGPGEVTVAGRKVVGISQRRTRAGARFQTVMLLRSQPADLAELVGLGPRGADELARVAVGVGELAPAGVGGSPLDPEAIWALVVAGLDRF
jgi:lipoate-protein ligase A